jgi:gas vesicle protein
MNWKTQTLIIGTVVGAITGAVSALLLVRHAEETQTTPQITANDGVKIGMGAMGLVRMIGDLGKNKSIKSG